MGGENKNNIYDEIDLVDVPKTSGKKFGPGGTGKYIAIGIGFLLIIVLLLALIFKGPGKVDNAKNTAIGQPDNEVNAVKNFAIDYMNKFYWLNRDSYLDIRNELEKLMTVTCLQKYKAKFYDQQFQQDVIDGTVIVSPTYNAVMYKKDTAGAYVRILGDIKLVNGMTGAETKIVNTWTLKIINEEGRYLVEDFIIETGK